MCCSFSPVKWQILKVEGGDSLPIAPIRFVPVSVFTAHFTVHDPLHAISRGWGRDATGVINSFEKEQLSNINYVLDHT